MDGILSADPRVVTAAIPVPFLTYEEATELAYFGAQARSSMRFGLPTGASSAAAAQPAAVSNATKAAAAFAELLPRRAHTFAKRIPFGRCCIRRQCGRPLSPRRT